MAERAKRTIDPDRVGNADAWLRYFKQGYSNLVQRDNDSALLVLSPTTPTVDNPVKTFALQRGQDARLAMSDEELRATAQSHLDSLRSKQRSAMSAADEEYRSKESELLSAIQEWKQMTDPTLRGVAARTIGGLQKELAALDERRSQTANAVRTIQSRELMRVAFDPDTRDMRKLAYPVFTAFTSQFSTKDVVITEGDMA
jgi:hypothetical protein